MTPTAPAAPPGLAALHEAAAAAGLAVSSSASWPETDADREVTPLPGFVESNFSPLLAEVAGRALRDRGQPPASGKVTAVVIATALGDVTSAARVAAAVDAGKRVAPLLFFQSVPNAVAGYLAARWHLTGPVVCVTGTTAALDVAVLLIDDADADEVLVARVDLAVTDGDRDRAAAIVVTRPAGNDPEPHEP
jgi:3-oxoacyl-(acyl-carrier-protein) synthase